MTFTPEQTARLLLLEADFAAIPTGRTHPPEIRLIPLTDKARQALKDWRYGDRFLMPDYQIQWWRNHYDCKVIVL